MPTRSRITAFVALAAVLVAGCGADDGDDAEVIAGGARPLAVVPTLPGATTIPPPLPTVAQETTTTVEPMDPLVLKCAEYVSRDDIGVGDVRKVGIRQAANNDPALYAKACDDMRQRDPMSWMLLVPTLEAM